MQQRHGIGMSDLMRFAGQEGSVANVPQVASDVSTGEDLVKELEGAVIS